MKHPSILLLSLVLLGAASPMGAAEAVAPNADQILRSMSSKLAKAKQFTFAAERHIDATLIEGGSVPEKASVEVSVSRPNQLAARSVSKQRTLRFIADGKRITVFNETMNHYSQVPMRASIDQLVDGLDEIYGFVPPLAEFALSDPYKDIRRQAHTVTYLGQGKVGGFFGIGGVDCHRLGLKGKVADAELWIATGDQLPRKLVATFHSDGKSQVRIDFKSWDLNAPAAPGAFTFSPPQGSQKIEMWTKSRMQAARKN